jgi:hypothetical protein
MKTAMIAAALLVAASGAVLAPTSAQAQVSLNIIIGNPPPPPRYEVVPRPRPGYIWAPGYWSWSGHNHDWRAGHWERVREGQAYYRPQWVQAGNGWQLQEGGWRRGHVEHYQQHDRDDHGRHDYRQEDRDGHGHGHGGGHCPPGQAKKGNC